MGVVYDRTDSGLLVARESAEGSAVARALRDHDADLRLVPQFSESYGGVYWAVYRYAGSERPADLVCAWVDHERGEPKPLSFGLVERVKELDRAGRGQAVESDEGNAALRERNARERERLQEDLIDDWKRREGRSAVLPRGQHLRQARSRTGYHEKRPR